MADLNDIVEILEMMDDANLSFPPRDIKATARVWTAFLEDVPSATLKQAAKDHILDSTDFPKLAEIRQRAVKVAQHNNTSAVSDPFTPQGTPQTQWLPAGIQKIIFPPDVQRAIDTIIERIGDGVMSDAQIEYIDAKVASYLEGVTV